MRFSLLGSYEKNCYNNRTTNDKEANMNQKYYRYYFIAFMAWSCTYSMITVYLNEYIGISAARVGAFMSFIPLITMVFQPFWGAVSDSRGNRKAVLTKLMIITGMIAIIMPMVHSELGAFLGYALFMVFLAGQNPISDGMAMNYVNLEAESASYGAIRTWGSVGYAFGAFVVAQLASVFGLQFLFYFAFLGYAISLYNVKKLKSYGITRERQSYLKDLKQLLRNPSYAFLLVFTFLLIGAFFAGEQFVFMYTRAKGVSLSELGIITSVSVVIEIPLIFYSKRILDRWGLKKMLWLLTLTNMLRMVVLGFSLSFWWFFIAGIIRGVFVGSFIPFFIELIGRMTDDQLVTSGIAIYSAVSTGLGSFVFTMVGSAVTALFNYQIMYFSLAGIIFIDLLLLGKMNALIAQTASQ